MKCRHNIPIDQMCALCERDKHEQMRDETHEALSNTLLLINTIDTWEDLLMWYVAEIDAMDRALDIYASHSPAVLEALQSIIMARKPLHAAIKAHANAMTALCKRVTGADSSEPTVTATVTKLN